jgi:nucleoside-triphosphatase
LKVFLYGKRGAGKSTIIKRLMDELALKASGFRTIRGPADAEGRYDFYMTGAAGDIDMQSRIGYSYMDGRWGSFSEAFETSGVELLMFGEKPEIIVMDELGFMETRAERFQRRVLEILDEDIPVIGVVKNRPEPFLQKIFDHPSVTAIEVTEENRNSVYTELKEMFSQNRGDT